MEHRRRPRYPGKNPRRFEHKYKELDPEQHPDTVAKVLASGKTPAGSHVPIMVAEILDVLQPRPGEFAVDCTLGHGGHAHAILERIQPGGHLLGLDADPLELPRTEARLRNGGFDSGQLAVMKSNFAGLPAALAKLGRSGADLILADLGVSSMQLDNPLRGFSAKSEGPLDMRMNPTRGLSAAQWVQKVSSQKLAIILAENSDEPHAAAIAHAIAGQSFATTLDLATAIRRALPTAGADEIDLSVRRVFQTIRIEVNEEFSALDTFLRVLPRCLNHGGRVAILTFHSGEDRRVKKSFQAAHREGLYREISRRVLRASPEERRNNPRSTPAKLRWAIRSM
ncbi:MAG: 16S rRNA (cytosine(1402)-N(4))-methyltransferase RsmH [Chthoniobacterales bacterium]|nr:16S rRNA (cytosine(1402)-N(4))-methyltransferase RsmH [Chthoniobacterales bacterium]